MGVFHVRKRVFFRVWKYYVHRGHFDLKTGSGYTLTPFLIKVYKVNQKVSLNFGSL